MPCNNKLASILQQDDLSIGGAFAVSEALDAMPTPPDLTSITLEDVEDYCYTGCCSQNKLPWQVYECDLCREVTCFDCTDRDEDWWMCAVCLRTGCCGCVYLQCTSCDNVLCCDCAGRDTADDDIDPAGFTCAKCRL